jgi:hypothetical protein
VNVSSTYLPSHYVIGLRTCPNHYLTRVSFFKPSECLTVELELKRRPVQRHLVEAVLQLYIGRHDDPVFFPGPRSRDINFSTLTLKLPLDVHFSHNAEHNSLFVTFETSTFITSHIFPHFFFESGLTLYAAIHNLCIKSLTPLTTGDIASLKTKTQ